MQSSNYMWQSHVEIESYSVAYFDCIAAFEAPYHWTSVKGGAHMCFVDSLDIHASPKCVWALPKFSDTVLQTQRCDRNTRWNNFRFLHRTATRHTFNYVTYFWELSHVQLFPWNKDILPMRTSFVVPVVSNCVQGFYCFHVSTHFIDV